MDTREANHLGFIIAMLENNGDTETAKALKNDCEKEDAENARDYQRRQRRDGCTVGSTP